jgi:AraC-like DNA-binding protein
MLHYHDELELLSVHTGRFLCRVDGKDYIAEAGDIIFVNSGVPHETLLLSESCCHTLLQFRESSFLNTEIRKIIKYSVKLANLEGEGVLILRSDELFRATEYIVNECEEKKPAYEILVRSEILKIIGLLYRSGILSDGEQVYSSAAMQKILPAMIYINQNYAQDLTLADVSTHIGFDKSYFCRIFRQATGATFTEYLNFVRICKAEKRLATTQDSILDISADVGFTSVSYFNKIFKRYRNCSPSFYRSARYCRDI